MENTICFYKDSKSAIMALLIKSSHTGEGIEFLTDDSAYQQVAYMGHPAGHRIIPHFHNKIKRTVDYTCETLIIRKGILEVVLYEKQVEKYRFNISPGDVITLYSGGHGFNVIEDVEMIEVKQGPFMGSEDKTRF